MKLQLKTASTMLTQPNLDLNTIKKMHCRALSCTFKGEVGHISTASLTKWNCKNNYVFQMSFPIIPPSAMSHTNG